MFETIGFVIMVFLAFTVCVACTAVSFLIIDQAFEHRISESLTAWYDRKFGVEYDD